MSSIAKIASGSVNVFDVDVDWKIERNGSLTRLEATYNINGRFFSLSETVNLSHLTRRQSRDVAMNNLSFDVKNAIYDNLSASMGEILLGKVSHAFLAELDQYNKEESN
jgi:ribosome-associated toxin RatA of RatAB toxin-antitoxin module